MRLTITLCLLFCITSVHASDGLISDLQVNLKTLDENKVLKLSYNFEGCYGPYHHGTITFEYKQGKLHFLHENFNDKGESGIAQAGSFTRQTLQDVLDKMRTKNSSEIFGNVINYQIEVDANIVIRSADRITQRHFTTIFEPFSSVFDKEEKSIIPKISSGGFVH